MATVTQHMTDKVLLTLTLVIAATTVEADSLLDEFVFLLDELVVCRDLPDDARLICYDDAVDRSREGTSGRSSPAAPASPAAAAAPAAATAATSSVDTQASTPAAAPAASAADTPATASAAPVAAAAAAPDTSPAASSAQQGASISQEDLFGKNKAQVQQTVEEATGEEQLESLNAEVTRLQQSGYDKVLITLDNGQIWRQVDSSSLRLRVGDAIEIERAALGSYMLKKRGSKRSMRVSRED